MEEPQLGFVTHCDRSYDDPSYLADLRPMGWAIAMKVEIEMVMVMERATEVKL